MRKLLALSGLIVLLDQATKLAVKGFHLFGIHHDGMYIGQSVSFLGDVVRFTFIENPGMAFGLDFGVPLLLGLFSIGAAIFLVHLLRRSRDGKIGGFHIALAMILGGAIGNLIDRVFYGLFYGYAPLFRGKVVDFIDVDIPNVHLFGRAFERFYIFNIADAAVSVGIILLLIFYPKQQKEQQTMTQGKNGHGTKDGGGGSHNDDTIGMLERQRMMQGVEGMPYINDTGSAQEPHQSHDSSDSHRHPHSSGGSHSSGDGNPSSHGSSSHGSHSHDPSSHGSHHDSGSSYDGGGHSGGHHSGHDSTSHDSGSSSYDSGGGSYDSGGGSYDSGSSDSGSSWSSD